MLCRSLCAYYFLVCLFFQLLKEVVKILFWICLLQFLDLYILKECYYVYMNAKLLFFDGLTFVLKFSFLYLVMHLAFKFTWLEISITIYCFSFGQWWFFSPFQFQFFRLSYYGCISQAACNCFILMSSDKLGLSIGMFNLFTCNVITDMFGFISIVLHFFSIYPTFFLLSCLNLSQSILKLYQFFFY